MLPLFLSILNAGLIFVTGYIHSATLLLSLGNWLIIRLEHTVRLPVTCESTISHCTGKLLLCRGRIINDRFEWSPTKGCKQKMNDESNSWISSKVVHVHFEDEEVDECNAIPCSSLFFVIHFPHSSDNPLCYKRALLCVKFNLLCKGNVWFLLRMGLSVFESRFIISVDFLTKNQFENKNSAHLEVFQIMKWYKCIWMQGEQFMLFYFSIDRFQNNNAVLLWKMWPEATCSFPLLAWC